MRLLRRHKLLPTLRPARSTQRIREAQVEEGAYLVVREGLAVSGLDGPVRIILLLFGIVESPLCALEEPVQEFGAAREGDGVFLLRLWLFVRWGGCGFWFVGVFLPDRLGRDDVLQILLQDEDVELQAGCTVRVHRANVSRACDEGVVDEACEARGDELAFCGTEVSGYVCVERDQVVVELENGWRGGSRLAREDVPPVDAGAWCGR